MRPLLQDWERWLFHGVYKSKHRKSSKMRKRGNMLYVEQ